MTAIAVIPLFLITMQDNVFHHCVNNCMQLYCFIVMSVDTFYLGQHLRIISKHGVFCFITIYHVTYV